MFSSCDQAPTSFNSCWKTEKSLSESSSQTQPLSTFNKENQVSFNSEVAVQTDREQDINYSPKEDNDFKILAFLQRIAPKVEEELERASRSRAFDNYSLLDENRELVAKRLHILRWPDILPDHSVIDVSWSCTGSVIAVGYGVKLHDDWCSHKSAIAVWNINRKEFAANAPDQVMEVATCVTCLSFHPTSPALLGVGNMAGEIMVYDLSQSLDAVPLLRADSGGVSITRLEWVHGFESNKGSSRSSHSVLVSTTVEGTALVWSLQLEKVSISLLAGFFVRVDDIPRDMRFRSGGNEAVELTCISFASDDSSRFLLGTEGGSILLCSTRLLDKDNKTVNGIGLNKCIVSSLAPHNGRVLEVASSKFHRHAVLSVGSDKSLRLHSLLQPSKPISVILSEDAVTCAKWLPSRPLVIATGKSNGGVTLYSFAAKSSEQPLLELPSSERPSPISALVFNSNNLKLLACGDHLGRVFLWQLPDSILSAPASEAATLDALVRTSSE